MAKKIQIAWQEPIDLSVEPLKPGPNPKGQRTISWGNDERKALEGYGVYIFVRCERDLYIPLYIGISKNVRTRVSQHFTIEASKGLRRYLRGGVTGAKRGEKKLVVGMLSRSTTNPLSVLKVVERMLIVNAVTWKQGKYKDELFNIQGNYDMKWLGNQSVRRNLTCMKKE